jgi:hypothetical protein
LQEDEEGVKAELNMASMRRGMVHGGGATQFCSWWLSVTKKKKGEGVLAARGGKEEEALGFAERWGAV